MLAKHSANLRKKHSLLSNIPSILLTTIDLTFDACDRTSKTARFVHRTLTCPTAIKIYGQVILLVAQACYFTILAGMMARNWWECQFNSLPELLPKDSDRILERGLRQQSSLTTTPIPSADSANTELSEDIELHTQRFDDLMEVALTETIRSSNNFSDYAEIADESHIPFEWLLNKNGKPLTGKVRQTRIQNILAGKWVPSPSIH